MRVAGFFLGDEEGNGQDVLRPHLQPHVGVFQVYLAEVDWYETQVVSEHLPEDALERPLETHRLHGG